MKKFAFFLPQFHEVSENNKWWGQGFTEWTKVKDAKKLFSKHMQPKVPLDQNYYNLLMKTTVDWQTSLIKKYHIDGFIYYHYYFKGRHLLEKPAENLLHWKDVEQSYFFCWANHTWCRSWNHTKEILLEQVYGEQKDWEEHFLYLLPFFRDKRYEKRNNKPVFMIFKSDFFEKKEMFSYFERRCKESGFDGICLIETYVGEKWPLDYNKFVSRCCSQTEFKFLREPSLGLNLYWTDIRYSPVRIFNKIRNVLAHHGFKACVEKYNGNKLYDLKKKYEIFEPSVIHGLCFEWDNTPRHGEWGYIITPLDKEHFFFYMDSIQDEEYVFINAWNEWAEGMMLEPTEEKGYQYLEWLLEWSMKKEAV